MCVFLWGRQSRPVTVGFFFLSLSLALVCTKHKPDSLSNSGCDTVMHASVCVGYFICCWLGFTFLDLFIVSWYWRSYAYEVSVWHVCVHNKDEVKKRMKKWCWEERGERDRNCKALCIASVSRPFSWEVPDKKPDAISIAKTSKNALSDHSNVIVGLWRLYEFMCTLFCCLSFSASILWAKS